jgi:hypothetical protein
MPKDPIIAIRDCRSENTILHEIAAGHPLAALGEGNGNPQPASGDLNGEG